MAHASTSRPELFDYVTGARLRLATRAEERESIAAAKRDGGAGVITATARGAERSCYVQ